MKTHTLAAIPQTWIGKPVVLLDDDGKPFVSGHLVSHDVRRTAACEECGHQRGLMARVALQFRPGRIGEFDLPAETRVAAGEVKP